jgi:hypothetical protein
MTAAHSTENLLTESDVFNIRIASASGYHRAGELAAKYGVSIRTIKDVAYQRRGADIKGGPIIREYRNEIW